MGKLTKDLECGVHGELCSKHKTPPKIWVDHPWRHTPSPSDVQILPSADLKLMEHIKREEECNTVSSLILVDTGRLADSIAVLNC